jgi:hypothetical protein
LHHPVHPLHLVDDPGRNRCHRRMAPHVRFEFQTANYKGRVSSARWIRLRVAAARNARVMHQMCPSENRGRREDRVPTAPMVRVQQKSTRQNHRYRRIIRPSLRDGFNGFLRALSGDHAWLPPSPRGSYPQNLAPASERQDHTTSPSASAPLVLRRCRVHRIPLPTSVTIASRPSHGCETSESIVLICPTTQRRGRATDWHDGQNEHISSVLP